MADTEEERIRRRRQHSKRVSREKRDRVAQEELEAKRWIQLVLAEPVEGYSTYGQEFSSEA